MKKTHQIGLMAALLAGVAYTLYAHDPGRAKDQPVKGPGAFHGISSGQEFRSERLDFYWQQTQSFGNGDSVLNTLGARLAYSFGM